MEGQNGEESIRDDPPEEFAAGMITESNHARIDRIQDLLNRLLLLLFLLLLLLLFGKGRNAVKGQQDRRMAEGRDRMTDEDRRAI